MPDILIVDDEARTGIHALLASENKAWNKGNAEEFAAWALPEIVFTNVMGMFSVGKGPFVAQHKRIFASIYKGSTIEQEVQHITLLKLDVAIVDTLAVVTGAHSPPPGVALIDGAIHARLEQVLLRMADGWWVASFHNVSVNPAALSGPPIASED